MKNLATLSLGLLCALLICRCPAGVREDVRFLAGSWYPDDEPLQLALRDNWDFHPRALGYRFTPREDGYLQLDMQLEASDVFGQKVEVVRGDVDGEFAVYGFHGYEMNVRSEREVRVLLFRLRRLSDTSVELLGAPAGLFADDYWQMRLVKLEPDPFPNSWHLPDEIKQLPPPSE